MKKLFTLLMAINLITISSCTKNGTQGNKVSSPFTVMYELTSNSSIVSDGGGGIQYTNSAQGSSGISSTLIRTLPWNTTITVTAENRPLTFSFRVLPIQLFGPGTITANIYINGKKKATVTESSSKAGGSTNLKDYASLNMQYVVE